MRVFIRTASGYLDPPAGARGRAADGGIGKIDNLKRVSAEYKSEDEARSRRNHAYQARYVLPIVKAPSRVASEGQARAASRDPVQVGEYTERGKPRRHRNEARHRSGE